MKKSQTKKSNGKKILIWGGTSAVTFLAALTAIVWYGREHSVSKSEAEVLTEFTGQVPGELKDIGFYETTYFSSKSMVSLMLSGQPDEIKLPRIDVGLLNAFNPSAPLEAPITLERPSERRSLWTLRGDFKTDEVYGRISKNYNREDKPLEFKLEIYEKSKSGIKDNLMIAAMFFDIAKDGKLTPEECIYDDRVVCKPGFQEKYPQLSQGLKSLATELSSENFCPFSGGNQGQYPRFGKGAVEHPYPAP